MRSHRPWRIEALEGRRVMAAVLGFSVAETAINSPSVGDAVDATYVNVGPAVPAEDLRVDVEIDSTGHGEGAGSTVSGLARVAGQRILQESVGFDVSSTAPFASLPTDPLPLPGEDARAAVPLGGTIGKGRDATLPGVAAKIARLRLEPALPRTATTSPGGVSGEDTDPATQSNVSSNVSSNALPWEFAGETIDVAPRRDRRALTVEGVLSGNVDPTPRGTETQPPKVGAFDAGQRVLLDRDTPEDAWLPFSDSGKGPADALESLLPSQAPPFLSATPPLESLLPGAPVPDVLPNDMSNSGLEIPREAGAEVGVSEGGGDTRSEETIDIGGRVARRRGHGSSAFPSEPTAKNPGLVATAVVLEANEVASPPPAEKLASPRGQMRLRRWRAIETAVRAPTLGEEAPSQEVQKQAAGSGTRPAWGFPQNGEPSRRSLPRLRPDMAASTHRPPARDDASLPSASALGSVGRPPASKAPLFSSGSLGDMVVLLLGSCWAFWVTRSEDPESGVAETGIGRAPRPLD